MKEIDPHLPINETARKVVSKVSEPSREFHSGHKITSSLPLPMEYLFELQFLND